ncbi:MAG: hypothetical protein ACYTFE_01520 [Planctomycetota bacterium]
MVLTDGALGLILIPMLDLFVGLSLLIAGLGELIFGIDFGALYLGVILEADGFGLWTIGGLL